MAVFKKILIIWLCVSLFLFYAPASAEAGVTVKKPQGVLSPEIDIPSVEEAKSSQGGGGKWLWAILGVALVGGVVAALAGGGDDGGGEKPDPTGSYEATW